MSHGDGSFRPRGTPRGIASTAGTGYAYVTTKNKRTSPDKIQIKKFDPIVRKHVLFVEKKISKG